MSLRNLNHLRLVFLALVAVWLSGCANIQKYSIESYQGPFPIHDRQYVEITED